MTRTTALLPAGSATGVGSLPHTDAAAAADDVLAWLPELPSIPSLPRRSPAERMLAQASVGIPGVRADADGDVSVDLGRFNPEADFTPDLAHDAFGGLRAFLAAATGRKGPVKWQCTGPVTLGLALERRGVRAAEAFSVASRAVRAHLTTVGAAVASALPGAVQVVVIDDPALTALVRPDFPLPADDAIDLLSTALAAAGDGVAGVHCCGRTDWPTVLAAGPALLSLPVDVGIAEAAGFLADHLDRGGWVAWGAVPTDRPVGGEPDRHWRVLAALWCDLAAGGCDVVRLRCQSLVTPACGLAFHDLDQAQHIVDMAVKLARRVEGQALATQLTLGA
jgi:hypothetical protein